MFCTSGVPNWSMPNTKMCQTARFVSQGAQRQAVIDEIRVSGAKNVCPAAWPNQTLSAQWATDVSTVGSKPLWHGVPAGDGEAAGMSPAPKRSRAEPVEK